MDVKAAERILRQAGIRTDVLPGQKLTIVQGDVVRVNMSFQYRGPAQTVTPYASIGKITLGIFDEIASARGANKSLTQSDTLKSYTAYVDISSSNCKPEANYDLTAKLEQYPGETVVELTDVIDVMGAMEFSNFQITGYDLV